MKQTWKDRITRAWRAALKTRSCRDHRCDLVFAPDMAAALSLSDEYQTWLAQSIHLHPVHAQVFGSGRNAEFSLPHKLYGLDLYISDCQPPSTADLWCEGEWYAV